MEQTAVLVLLFAAVIGLFAPGPRIALESVLHRNPRWMLAVPLLFTAVFGASAGMAGANSLPIDLLVLAYTAAPAVCAFAQGTGPVAQPTGWDFVAVLLLWLPIEFSVGVASLIARPAQGFLHSVAYGIAILLGLIIFTCFRSVPGMKLNPPSQTWDYWLPLAAFVIVAPVLIVVGIALGFIPPPHAPTQSAGTMISSVGIVFAATALPEEILFRSLIQNFLTLRFGGGAGTLLAAAFIFGCAHLNNGPRPLPNWRYMILATIAGVAYGVVFRKTSTVLSSAALHMLVDWTKHFFF